MSCTISDFASLSNERRVIEGRNWEKGQSEEWGKEEGKIPKRSIG